MMANAICCPVMTGGGTDGARRLLPARTPAASLV
jgi:hypothetical protein